MLFCPGGQVQETGAANFLLIREGELLTRSLDSTFLHGVTRDSLLTLARDMGYKVSERVFDVLEMLDWVQHRRSGAVGHRRGARRRGHADLSRHRASGGERRGRAQVTAALRAQAGRDSAGRSAGPSRLAGARLGRLARRSVLLAILFVLIV